MDEPNTRIDFPENDFRDSQTAENIFLFRKLAFPENMYFPEIVLRQPNAPYVYVWIALKTEFPLRLPFFYGSRALFTGPANTEFNKNNFKTRSHDTIKTFKNYFVIVFSVFSFSELAVSKQTLYQKKKKKKMFLIQVDIISFLGTKTNLSTTKTKSWC